jgi:hypothetical protein
MATADAFASAYTADLKKIETTPAPVLPLRDSACGLSGKMNERH